MSRVVGRSRALLGLGRFADLVVVDLGMANGVEEVAGEAVAAAVGVDFVVDVEVAAPAAALGGAVAADSAEVGVGVEMMDVVSIVDDVNTKEEVVGVRSEAEGHGVGKRSNPAEAAADNGLG